MLRKLLIWNLPLALCVLAAFAQTGSQSKDLKEMQKQASRLDSQADLGQTHDAVFESLSKQLNIPVATLQDEQKATNFGFGQLFIANSLAAASGKSFEEISQEFQSGKGWGEIANENDLRLGKVVSDLKRVNNQIDKNRMENETASRSQRNGTGASVAGSNAGGSSGSHAGGNANSQGASHGQAGAAGGRGRR